MSGLLSGRISAAGVTDRGPSLADPDGAALKNMKAKKQLAAQARIVFMDSNVTPPSPNCRSV
jgi:hypothetical protein